MLDAGFENEVRKLMDNPKMHDDLPSMRCVGYRQMWQHLLGEVDKQQMTDQALAATRQLAKRQITWLRSMPNCKMVDPFVESLVSHDNILDQWVNNSLKKL